MAEVLDLLVEWGCWGMLSRPLRGSLWRVSCYDKASNLRAAGSADTMLEALAWMLVDREERRRGLVVMARNDGDVPEVVLARLLASSPAPAMPVVAPAVPSAAARRSRSRKAASSNG